jgi:hypothetical protein
VYSFETRVVFDFVPFVTVVVNALEERLTSTRMARLRRAMTILNLTESSD